MNSSRNRFNSGVISGLGNIFFFLLCSLLILAFVLPTWLIPVPYGTDVYTHLFMTRMLSSVNSLSQFYTYCFEEGYLTYDYPFGLWLFGSIVAKITGMGMLELSRILPFAIMFILITLYFFYTRIFGISSEDKAILSVIFFLSMPLMCLEVLAYQTRTIAMLFLISIIYLILVEKKISLWKRAFLINVLIFSLCITHTGTYMFLLMLTIVYLFIYAIFSGDLHRDSYMAAGSMLFLYIITMHLFPHVHPQYIDKGRILISVGEFLTSNMHVPHADELTRMFYEQIFLELNPLYVIFVCLVIYAVCRFLIFSHHKIKVSGMKSKFSEKYLSIPIIGSIRHVSHSILYTPFWLGPVHTVLAILGVFKANRKGLCMLFAVSAVTLLPSYIGGEAGTGALREIKYFFIIVPPLAALGFYYGKEKIEPYMNSIFRRFFAGVLLLGVFFSVVVLPIIGNLYYHPLISGPKYERTGLSWLGHIGTPDEGCAGWGYRHMISIYANKKAPSVTTVAKGRELGRFIDDQRNVLFNFNLRKSEEGAKDLYATFGVSYLILSERVLHNLGKPAELLGIDYNTYMDKIYSSRDFFSIYRYVEPLVSRVNLISQIEFQNSPLIKDAGDSYIVDTEHYKIRISKETPKIFYIGNKTHNFLGDGAFEDFIRINWESGFLRGKSSTYTLHELANYSVLLGKNQIIYKTVLKNADENRATLSVKYVFFDKAIKREIIVSNDWVNSSTMNVYIISKIITPMKYFEFEDSEMHKKKRRIYPSVDPIELEDIKFNKIFINDGKLGIYIEYEDSAPYPTRLVYMGFEKSGYSLVSIYANKYTHPAESMHLTQWIAVGDNSSVRRNVESYSVSIYPYPNGEIPIILVVAMNNLDTTSVSDFNLSRTYKELKNLNVVYTEAVSTERKEINVSRMEELLNEHNVHLIGYLDEPSHSQEDIIRLIDNADIYYNINLEGFLIRKYDIELIKILDEEKILFVISKVLRPPLGVIFPEGYRHPQITYYHGEKTNLVLLPISGPLISGSTYPYSDREKAWRAVIDHAIKNDELVVFLWNSKDISKPENLNKILNVTKYAQEKGMTFTTPHRIAKHFSLLQNISAVISEDDSRSEIIISVRNNNEEDVNGVTFKIKVPNREYTVSNGKVVRINCSSSACTYYVSVDLSSKEVKNIILRRIY